MKINELFSELSGNCSAFMGVSPRETLETKARALKGLFRDLDAEVERFRKQAGLTCPQRCGHCCEKARVETSELEMLPMAFELIRRGEDERFYEAAEKLDFEGRCVFYESDARHPGQGRCARYDFRPMICRLFAFSGNADKYGQTRTVICGIIKTSDPESAQRATGAVAAGQLRPPVMADFMMKASSIDTEMARERIPINLALKRAVDRVWLHQKFSS